MKAKLLFIFMVLFCITASAQDVIVKSDGSIIQAKVLKVTKTEVEYKRFLNNDGPTFTLPITEIRSITYENGEKDTFKLKNNIANNIDLSTPTTYMSASQTNVQQEPESQSFDKALDSYQKKEYLLRCARTNKTWGTVFMVVGCGAAVAGGILSITDVVDKDVFYGLLIGGIVVGSFVGGSLHGIAARQEKEANKIRIASIFEKDFQLGNDFYVSPSIKLIANNSLQKTCNYSIGLGASLTF